MGTKSKKFRAFLVWMCFFLGASVFLGLAVLGLGNADEIINHFGDIMAVIRWDIKDTSKFKQEIANHFEHLMRVAKGTNDAEGLVYAFSDEGENLLYYAENLITGKTLGNIEKETVLAQETLGSLNGDTLNAWDKVILPQGYDYYIYYNGSEITVQNRNRTVNAYSYENGYQNTLLRPYLYRSSDFPEVRALLMVKKDLVENYSGLSSLYMIKQWAQRARRACFWVLGIVALDLIMLLIALVRRSDKREFDRTLARISGRLWFEVKLVFSLFVLLFFFHTVSDHGFSIASGILNLCGLWWFYTMLVDLLTNRKQFFANNSITWLVGHYRRYESKKPFQKALLWRIYALVAAEVILVFFAFVFAAAGHRVALMAIPFVAAGLYLLYLYLRRFRRTVNDLGLVVERIEAMKNGKYEGSSSLSPDSDFYRAWENLTLIQSGIQNAVEEKVRSERMKMELITNVSHDLKTPLTSIISYTDLIGREEGLPDTVKDYVQILSQKSDRLKTLIQDLFELSRAASGDMVLAMERIDLVRLMEQTLADMSEQIEQSDLTFKVKVPSFPVYIMSDGRRLYRVFQNLISNALKYSMKSSRVYVNLISDNNRVIVEIKNIAGYEMDFDSEEIMERFVRGDKARSTEGSGLGLAIARSFTHACGGRFDISIDGDLFKVTLSFNQLTDEEYNEGSLRRDDGTLPEKEESVALPQGEVLEEEDEDSLPQHKSGEEDPVYGDISEDSTPGE